MNTIIDGNNLLHRTYWISQNKNNTNKGFNPLCLHLFLKSLRAHIENFRPDRLYMVWDKKLCWPSTNFRKTELMGQYKGTRDTSHSEDVYSHEETLEHLCQSLGIYNFHPYKLEADDVISWLTTKLQPNIIVTADKDMLQLVSQSTSYYHIMKKKLITPENFFDEIGVQLGAYVYYKAILGDTSDNIAGFPGYGKVRSNKLAHELKDSNNDIDKISITEEYKMLFKRNIRLCDLNNSWENEKPHEEEAYKEQLKVAIDHTPNFEEFENLCNELNLNEILKNIEDWKAIFTFKEKTTSIIDMLSK